MIKKNLLYNSLLSVSQILFPLIIFPYTFKVLEPQGTGLVSFTESLTQYLISLSAIGIPIYGIREVSKVKGDLQKLQKLFTELVSIQLIFTLLISAVYAALIFYIPKLASHKELYFMSCGVLIINIFSVEWLFQGLEQFKYIAVRTVAIRMLFILLILLLVKYKEDAVIYYGITFITTLANAIVNFAKANKYAKLQFKAVQLKMHIKPLAHIFLATMAVNVYVILDTVILGFITNNDEIVGYYSTALKICKIPLALITALSAVLIPQISSAHNSGNQDYVKSLLKKSYNYVIILSVPIAVGLFLLAPDLVLLLANQQFLPAIPVIRILSLLTLIIGLSNIFGLQMLTSMGQERQTMYAVSIGMVLSLGCNLVLIPFYSYIGTAITTLFTEIVVTAITGSLALKIFKIRFSYKILGQCFFAAISFFPLYWALSLMQLPLVIKVGLMIFFAAIIYFAALIFIFRNIYLKQIFFQVLSKAGYGKV